MQLTPYVLVHVAAAVLLGGLGIYCWLNRTVPVTTSIAQVMFLCAGLALDYVFDLSSSTLADKLFWMKVRFFFLAVAPVLWLVLIVRYTGREDLVNRRLVAGLFVVPVITIVLAWTSDYHSLFRYDYRLDESGLFPIILWKSGPWYWIHICYSYCLFIASLILLVSSLRNAQSFYRRQTLMIIGGACLPVLADTVFHTGISQLPGYILSTTVVLLAGLMIVWALFRYAMVNFVPIARSAVLETMNDIMLVLDRHDNIVDFNRAAKEAFDLPSASTIGQPLEVFLSRWPDFLSRLRKSLDGNTVVRIDRGKNRQMFDLSINPLKGRKGEVTGRVVILRDITDRQKAETALRESEKRFRDVLENIRLLAVMYDTDGRITFCNDFVLELTGWKREEVVGRRWFETFVPPELRDGQSRSIFLRSIKREDFPPHYENEIVTKEGKRLSIAWNSTAFHDDQGTIIGVMSIGSDISDRKRVEAERQRMEERLRRAEKMEALGTLAGGVAHDLNNILNSIVGYPDLILMELPEEKSPLRDAIVTIRECGQRAAAVVQDLLTLARRGVVSTEVLNLNDVISQYMKTPEQQNTQLYHPDAHFELRLDDGLLPIRGSRGHLSKTIMNLLLNAAEAMPNGGVATISTTNAYLDRPVKGYEDVKEGDYVVLTVSDTGKGISPEDRGRIFEPFYTKKTMGRSGTGLGLAVVWGTVRDHNGYIDVQSELDRGTTFSLYFPVTREALTKDKPIVKLADYMGKGETILVVDDVKEQCELATSILRKLDYAVTAVSSGEEAIEYMKTGHADLLILDMIMDPGIDGLETYRRILEFHPGQKAIIVSGFSETERVRQTQELGAGTYVRKPYVMERLGLAIKRELAAGNGE